MSDLTYIPTDAPSRPFAVGDEVEVLDRRGIALSVQTVTKAGPRRIKTTCGRSWTPDGEWTDGRLSYPFPSIRLVAPSNAEVKPS